MKDILISGYGLSSVCRLCLSSGVTLLDIFALSAKKRNRLAKVIMKCASVKITRRNEMPGFICNLCYAKLEDIHQFQLKIVQSEKTLRRCLQKLHAFDKQIKLGYSIERTSEDPSNLASNLDISLKYESPQLNDLIDMSVIWAEKEPANVHSDDMSIKSEIKDDIIDDNSFIPSDCADDIAKTLSKNGDSEVSYEDSKIDIKDPKMRLTILKDNRSSNSTQKINKEVSLKCELENKVMVDDSISRIESNDDAQNASSEDDSSDIVMKRSKIKKKYQCHLCNISYARFSDFLIHKHTHLGEKTYHCDFCEKKYDNLHRLNIHKRIHTGAKPFRCDVCNKYYNQADSLKRHKYIHTGEKPFKCDLCNKSYTHRTNLSYHKRTHSGEKPHQCDICSKSFIGLSDMKIHKRTHTGEKPFQCDVCGKHFTYLGNFNYHKLTHTGEKPHQCDVCKKCFSQSSSLNIHKLIHSAKQSYPCDVCGKSFNSSYYLKIHKRSHSGEKPYKCVVCSKSFSQSGSLNSHKLTHRWEKSFQCDVCKKSFNHSNYLKVHKRLHTGEKPYTCDVCNKRFSQPGSLKTHQRTIHMRKKSCKSKKITK